MLLAQREVGEAREGGEGGRSSAMDKRNPAAAVSVLACAARVPGLVATVLAGMPQEHERAAGAWQAEWGTITDALRLTGSAAAWTCELLEGLEVDPARMRANLAGDEVDLGPAHARRARAARPPDGAAMTLILGSSVGTTSEMFDANAAELEARTRSCATTIAATARSRSPTASGRSPTSGATCWR